MSQVRGVTYSTIHKILKEGCSDSGCIIKPKRPGTNGGCSCIRSIIDCVRREDVLQDEVERLRGLLDSIDLALHNCDSDRELFYNLESIMDCYDEYIP